MRLFTWKAVCKGYMSQPQPLKNNIILTKYKHIQLFRINKNRIFISKNINILIPYQWHLNDLITQFSKKSDKMNMLLLPSACWYFGYYKYRLRQDSIDCTNSYTYAWQWQEQNRWFRKKHRVFLRQESRKPAGWARLTATDRSTTRWAQYLL